MKGQIIEKIATLSTAAFGLVAALAWNDTIAAIFKTFFGESGSLGAQIIYAVSVTIIAVFATIWIGKVAGRVK